MRQLHCPACKTSDASIGGRYKQCGREMVPLLGRRPQRGLGAYKRAAQDTTALDNAMRTFHMRSHVENVK